MRVDNLRVRDVLLALTACGAIVQGIWQHHGQAEQDKVIHDLQVRVAECEKVNGITPRGGAQ